MVKSLKILLFVLFLCVAYFGGYGQTFDNLQFIASDQLINPANTGNHRYKWRLYNNYFLNKTIAPKAYPSFFVAGDYTVSYFPDKLALGVYFKQEPLTNSPVNISRFFVTGAFHFRFYQSSLRLGIQPGLVYSALDQNALTFPDQYDRNTGGFDPGTPTLESYSIAPQTTLAINLGAAYRFLFKDKNYEIGLSYLYINAQKLEFYQAVVIPTFNATLKTEIHAQHLLLTPFIWVNHTNYNTRNTLGIFTTYDVKQKVSPLNKIIAGVNAGINTKNYPQSVAIIAGVQWKRMTVTLNYKFPYQFGNRLVHSFNTFELALVYNGFDASITQHVLPCEFY
ncbi:MAG: hypothetical protein CVU09_08920 [Bacteroidetes bacterium HGW-Bacteroidetes-4]|jgi:hypothetical protein|nr:MAG: hypothetical protein CVU09_08920 [Bacteroidetes bacterium HGW-Bacteroidetes-4]